MAKTDPEAMKREKRKNIQWVVTIFITTILISGMISLISDEVMAGSSLAVAFCILLAIIFLGILFDIIGMAVATADEKPFHSMASRKVPGAQEAIRLLRNAERVSSMRLARTSVTEGTLRISIFAFVMPSSERN